MVKNADFANKLLGWYDQHGRADLPWRQHITPYRVWISEIMLQQTQVNTVLPYFKRFEERFPDIYTLAHAPLDGVLHLWTGLGYYARARNLHKTANIVCTEFAGKLPEDPEQLQQLPGIGRSTAGAICAIAHDQPRAILDGNVKRVLSRHYAIEGWPGQSTIQKQLWQISEAITPESRCADYTQAIMDLGATLCTRSKPNCTACPVQPSCQSYSNDAVNQYPTRKPKKILPTRKTFFLVMADDRGHILLQKRPPVGIWGGLWSFPECENQSEIQEVCAQLDVTPLDTLDTSNQKNQPTTNDYQYGDEQRHTFSHYHLDYTPIYLSVTLKSQIAGQQMTWVAADCPGKLGLPRPVEKMLSDMCLNNLFDSINKNANTAN